jgi:hypothetical protein
MNEVAKVLNAAADLIEQRGWCRHRAQGPNGECCPVRAMGLASDYREPFRDACQAFRGHIGDDGIGRWNRAQPGPEPVVAALRAAC